MGEGGLGNITDRKINLTELFCNEERLNYASVLFAQRGYQHSSDLRTCFVMARAVTVDPAFKVFKQILFDFALSLPLSAPRGPSERNYLLML